MLRQARAPSLAKRLKRFLRYLVIRLALGVLGLLPVRVAGRCGRLFGKLVYYVSRRERSNALESLEQAFPTASLLERQLIAKRSFEHLGQLAFELSGIQKIDAEIESRVFWPPEDRLAFDQLFKRGRGIVFVSGHVGNWELLARRVALAGYPAQTIAKETTDPRLTHLVERFRSSGRLKSLWRGREGAAKGMLRAIKSGEILGLLIDQDTDVQSVFVPFFGRPARTPRAAADLALRTGAPVIMGFCQRMDDGGYCIRTEELKFVAGGNYEEDVTAMTAAMTQVIETAIRDYPWQWVWLHRRWKTQPA